MTEIICKRWILAKDIKAITLWPFIFYHGQPTEQTRSHELVHAEQIKKLGVLKFYALWIYYTARHGYQNNPLEREAYQKQKPL